MTDKAFSGLLLGATLFAGVVASSVTNAATVTFSAITDAVPGGLFDSAATHPDPGDPDTLIIALDGFTASSSGPTRAVDTITFVITAEPGFFLRTVSYTQGGTGASTALAGAHSTGSWTVGGIQSVFPTALFLSGSAGPWGGFPGITTDLTGLGLTSVPVSITSSLFAFVFAASGGGTATINITSAFVSATTGSPIPLPPAAFLLGSALVATMVVGAGTRSKS